MPPVVHTSPGHAFAPTGVGHLQGVALPGGPLELFSVVTAKYLPPSLQVPVSLYVTGVLGQEHVLDAGAV